MLYQIESNKPLKEIEQALQDSAARHRFGVLAVHDLQDTLKKKGIGLDLECRVYEICNPQQAKRVLETDPSVSTALPCRISVYGSSGKYTLAAVRPTEMLAPFNPGIRLIASEVEDAMLEIMRDAADSSR